VSTEACWTEGLDSTFKDNLNLADGMLDASSMKWQYFGTPSGLWRQFPGTSDFA